MTKLVLEIDGPVSEATIRNVLTVAKSVELTVEIRPVKSVSLKDRLLKETARAIGILDTHDRTKLVKYVFNANSGIPLKTVKDAVEDYLVNLASHHTSLVDIDFKRDVDYWIDTFTRNDDPDAELLLNSAYQEFYSNYGNKVDWYTFVVSIFSLGYMVKRTRGDLYYIQGLEYVSS